MRDILLLAVLLAVHVQHVMALSSRMVNITLVALSFVIILGAGVSCIIMYCYRGSKQPPLSSLENRTSDDLLVEDNINVDGKMKKRTKKKDKEREKEKKVKDKEKEKKSKSSKNKLEPEIAANDSDVERGHYTETAPLITPTSIPAPVEHLPPTPSPTAQAAQQKRLSTGFGFFGKKVTEQSVAQTNANPNGVHQAPVAAPASAPLPPVQSSLPPSPPPRPPTPMGLVSATASHDVDSNHAPVSAASKPPLGKDKEVAVMRKEKDETASKVDRAPLPRPHDKVEETKRKVPPLNLSIDTASRDGGNSSDTSPRDTRDETSSVKSKGSVGSSATNRVSLTRHLGSKASSGSEIGSRSSTPQPVSTLPPPAAKGSSVLQQKLEKLKQNKQAAAAAAAGSSASDTSDCEGVARASSSPISTPVSPRVATETNVVSSSTAPTQVNPRSPLPRDSSVGSVGNGSTASGGSKGGSFKAKSPLMNSALRNTFIATLSEGLQVVHHTEKGGQPSKLYYADNHVVIEKKAIFQRKPIKLDLKSIIRIEMGRKTAVLQAAGKSVQDNCCFSLILADGAVDIEMPSRAERDAVVEGFHILLQI